MPSVKTLYVILLGGLFLYFFMYSMIVKKLLVVQIYFQDGTRLQYGALLQENTEYNSALKEVRSNTERGLPSTRNKSLNFPGFIRSEKQGLFREILSFLEGFRIPVNKTSKIAENILTSRPLQINPNGVVLPSLMRKIDNFVNLSVEEPCPTSHLRDVGLLTVNNDTVKLEDGKKELYFVENGGQWTPNCRSRQKVAVIVPFRDRHEHLNIFLRHMHQFLRWQLLDYRIFVIEQADNERFNRGMLMNVGFTEARKVENFSCIVFHDVDLLPEDARNDYSCPSSPRHMSTAVNSMEYKLKYKTLFGGVEGFWAEHYSQVNGFPNRFWGWGGEDDDLYIRITKKQLSLTRPAQMIGRYTMLHHVHNENDPNPQRYNELAQSSALIDEDGLSTLKYIISDYQERPLYTIISVSLT
ncbi:beta-1,4-galactosyltransferase 4-like [Montipora capricornis]|uniref:beta-1,4-galactosyltransferase 4-like n=1 Tax=Montipora capricornis TaxID=246305 RepID=UPI0035F20DB1